MSVSTEVVTYQGRSGAKGSAKPKPCAKCDGNGFVMVQTQVGAFHYCLMMYIYHRCCALCQLGPGRYGTSRAMCTDCSGHGEKLREKDQCKKCKGKKTIKEKTRQEIFVERGMADRQRIVLAGAGDEEVRLFV